MDREFEDRTPMLLVFAACAASGAIVAILCAAIFCAIFG